jgi:hypothetical protein
VKKGTEFSTYRRKNDRHRRPVPHAGSSTSGSGLKIKDWSTEAGKYAKALTPAAAETLAADLGLPVEVIELVEGIGFTSHGAKDEAGEWVAAWTFPERDAGGVVTAVNRRFDRPVSINRSKPTNKAVFSGGRRGLTVPIGWKDRPGPVLVPEGVSDALSLSLCGLSCVGRPGSRDGEELLSKLLADYSGEIVIVGENDRKTDGFWPGKDGAVETAKNLTLDLGRSVKWALPPEGIKDSRAWVQDLARGFGEADDWHWAGREILRHLSAVAVEVGVGVDTPPADPPRYEFIPSDVFAVGDYRFEWGIRDAMVRKEPVVLGGPTKSLKTNMLVDLCVSLATATPFLGHFDVPSRMRVSIASGESGLPTLQETFRRVCRFKGIDAAGVSDWLRWCFKLPTLSDLTDVAEFVEPLTEHSAEIVAIDPLYLCLGADIDEKSIMKMGATLRSVGEMLVAKNIQPLIVHHANRKLERGQPMGLEHLAYVGLAEFARQWLLVSRREEYEHDGVHKLWLVVGGSAGFTGKYCVDVTEGAQGENFTGRVWEPVVAQYADHKKTATAEKECRKIEEEAHRRRADEETVLKAVDTITEKGHAPTVSRIRDQNTLSDKRVKSALNRLCDDGILVAVRESVSIGNGASRDGNVYRRKGTSGASGKPDVRADAPDARHRPGEHHQEHHPDTPIGGPGDVEDDVRHDDSRSNPRKPKPKTRHRARGAAPDVPGPAA